MARLYILISCVISCVWSFGPVQWRDLQLKRDTPSPFDHSNIRSMASVGDSFASGIGAGTRLTGWGNWWCSRYDSSYPSLLNTDQSLGNPDGRKFQYYACSGATTTGVMDNQIPYLEGGIQLLTLTIGGNDGDMLKNVLDACVFNFSKDYRLDCDKTLDEAQAVIDDPQYASNFDALIGKLKPKMADFNSKIFWTGYAHFWDTSTNECDKVSWYFKMNIGYATYLTQARRKKMNDLVDGVNQKIQEAVHRAGGQVIYVPWEANVVLMKGHFCEAGVDEAESNAIDRELTIFYEWGTTIDDKVPDDKDELKKRQTPGPQPETAPGVPPGQNLNDTWEGFITSSVLKGIAQGATAADFNLTNDDIVHAKTGLLLSDQWGRVFHPQKYGHLMIAENILRNLDDVVARILGQKAATTTLIGCPAPTGPASHSGGQYTCYSGRPAPNAAAFSVNDGNAAIKTFCSKHKHGKIPLNGIEDTVPNGSDQSSSIVLTATIDIEPACQKVQIFDQLNFYDCQSNMESSMNECDTNTMDKKMGGTHAAECITYSIKATKDAAAPAPAYATGQCSLHLNQTRDKPNAGDMYANQDDAPNYTVAIDIFDNNKALIGHHDDTSAGAGHSLTVDSRLQDQMVITPEDQHDYVQFVLGAQGWPSNDAGHCHVGDWDPKKADHATRQMDCTFVCT